MEPLATIEDAASYGLTVSTEALKRASVRVRDYTRQQISAGESTETLRGPLDRLLQRPVREIVSAKQGQREVRCDLLPGGYVELYGSRNVKVTYTHGYEIIPDSIIELACTIAARLDETSPGLMSGVQQEASGSESQTLGWDAWKALSSLTTEEKARLDAMFPPRPHVIRQGAR